MKLTHQERKNFQDRIDDASDNAPAQFKKLRQRAERAAAKAGERAVARARAKRSCAEPIQQAGEQAPFEDWELEWIRDYIRIAPDLATRVFYVETKESYLDSAVEAAGETAATEFGVCRDSWRDWLYEEDDEDEDPEET